MTSLDTPFMAADEAAIVDKMFFFFPLFGCAWFVLEPMGFRTRDPF